jgi:hypothetical protein
MTAITARLTFVRGNTEERVFRFLGRRDPRTPLDLTGSELVFRAEHPRGTLRRVLMLDRPEAGEAALRLEPAETRSLPPGTFTAFEIERRIGGRQTTLLIGLIRTMGGVNDD